ncbi:uncharacterized protein ACRADG_011341 [Cochliomyia hominivorax]
MNFFSRSSFGVIIGILNILIYIYASSFFIAEISRNHENENYFSDQMVKIAERRHIILCTILSVFLIMILISGVLILGITKRRHKFMIPWLIVSGLGFICDCARVIVMLIMGLANGISFSLIMYILLLSLLRCGLEALILWPIYTLWRDIRQENTEKRAEFVENCVNYDPPPAYNYYAFVPSQKSQNVEMKV